MTQNVRKWCEDGVKMTLKFEKSGKTQQKTRQLTRQLTRHFTGREWLAGKQKVEQVNS